MRSADVLDLVQQAFVKTGRVSQTLICFRTTTKQADMYDLNFTPETWHEAQAYIHSCCRKSKADIATLYGIFEVNKKEAAYVMFEVNGKRLKEFVAFIDSTGKKLQSWEEVTNLGYKVLEGGLFPFPEAKHSA